MSAIVNKEAGINTSWKVIYDQEAVGSIAEFLIDGISGDNLTAVRIILTGAVAGNATAPVIYLNDNITTADYRYVNAKATGTAMTAVTDTTTLKWFPVARNSDFWLSGSIFSSEIEIATTSQLSADHIIRCETSNVASGAPSLNINSGSLDITDEITRIRIGGDGVYGSLIGGGSDTFRFAAGTRCQVLGMS